MKLLPEVFESLAKELAAEDFDLMLVGDGSGTLVNLACGWACASYYRPSGRTFLHRGGASGGTNNYAELMPYLHCLWAFHTAALKKDPDAKPKAAVLIVSDSELTVNCGKRVYARRANLSLWASLDWFEANGYRLAWRHVRRNSNQLSWLADQTAGLTRKALDGLKKSTS